MKLDNRKILLAILVFAFIIRIAGINYGLPLQVIADEPPFTLGALKMLELKTIIPRFHLEEFQSVLYYPPYISYLYLPFFASGVLLKYMTYDGNWASYIQYLGSDLSDFFLIARFINILFAVLSIYLVYKIAKNIFNNESSALFAAFFLATETLHIILSFAARQWLLVSFILILILYLLSNPNYSFRKRYILSSFVAGVGMGISVICGFFVFIIALYFIFFEKMTIKELLSGKVLYISILIFSALILLPFILYPASIGFGGKVSIFAHKSFSDLLLSPVRFFMPVIRSEPVLFLSFIAGLATLLIKNRKFFWISFIFISSYSFLFYLAFRIEDRFFLPLVPLIAIISGYGIGEFYSLNKKVVLNFILIGIVLVCILNSSRLGYLINKGDSRQSLKLWIENNLPEGSRIIVDARLMRVSLVKDAIKEQERIDPGSLRQVDRSELYFGKSPIYRSFYALNLDTVRNKGVSDNLDKYIKDNKFEYFLRQEGDGSRFSVTDSRIGDSPLELFETRILGPEVVLYKIK